MKTPLLPITLFFSAALTLFTGCDWPGKPSPDTAWKPPAKVTNSQLLYSINCAGCHSYDSRHLSPSIPMNNATYLALIPQATMRNIIANGIPGTSMPAFSDKQGGSLTDAQIDILVSAIYANKNPADTPKEPLPPYSAPLGNVAAGAQAFGTYCASCHGAEGNGIPGKAGSVVNPAYLTLVSNQYLRTVTIVGRPELGMPNWKGDATGKTMSNQEIADIVAWLASHRPAPGAPAPSASPAAPSQPATSVSTP